MNYVYALIAAGLAWLFLERRTADQAGQGDQAGPVGGWMPAFDMPSWDMPMVDLAPVGGWMPGLADDTYPQPAPADVPDQLPSVAESFIVTAQQAAEAIPAALGLASAPVLDQGSVQRNERAFLDMIAYAEGTSGPDGYRTMFGGSLVDDLADHPRRYFDFTNGKGEKLRTSAAGRYQFLVRTWDALRAKLRLPDFGPASQDRAALELIRERGALGDVQAGRVAAAVKKCAPVWASLPGAGYAQPERKLSALLASYQAAGGNLEA